AASAASVAVAAVATPSAPVTAAAPVPPTLLRDEQQAWRELAQGWQIPVEEGDACTALARRQVQCFNRTMSLAMIRQLGRPGIVTLDRDTGQPSYAILAGLTDRTATLRAAGTEQTVTLAALAQRWHGEFGTLWRVPPGYGEKLRQGQADPTMEWTASRLALARGAPAPTRPAVFDAALAADVRSFQRAQGLPPDGRPGPLTYMQLNRASGVDEPRLRTEP
ncbi:peptidoglycan-binding protein, partial [Ramlibacter alkalitolerans]